MGRLNDSLRELWERAGYRTNFGSAAVLLPPGPDVIGIYHLAPAHFALSDLQQNRLKVAEVGDLNDPFELMAVSFRATRTRSAVVDFKNRYGRDTGLLCFSADWTNPVLWSHYGSKHKGICLGFNLKRTRAEKVMYKDQRVLANLPEPLDLSKIGPDLRNTLLCTKFKHWEYEEEYRTFVSLHSTVKDAGLHFYPFDNDLQLAEVITGPFCDETVDSVRNLVSARYPGAVTFGARLAYKWYAVVPDERTLPAR